MKHRITIHFEGTVQGVGFRQSAREVATGYEVAGTVRNLPDGRVELVAEGDEAELRAFLQAIDESHLAGLVRRREEAWAPASGGLKGFQIVR